MKILKNHYWLIISIVVFALDRLTKTLVMQNLVPEQPVGILPILNLFFTFNPGSAFSFLKDAGGWQLWLFIGIAIGVSITIVVWQMGIKQDAWLKVALALILGGALGNLYDRIVYHYVIDFLDFYFKTWHYPTFNLADSAICIGVGMLLLDMLKKERSK